MNTQYMAALKEYKASHVVFVQEEFNHWLCKAMNSGTYWGAI